MHSTYILLQTIHDTLIQYSFFVKGYELYRPENHPRMSADSRLTEKDMAYCSHYEL